MSHKNDPNNPNIFILTEGKNCQYLTKICFQLTNLKIKCHLQRFQRKLLADREMLDFFFGRMWAVVDRSIVKK